LESSGAEDSLEQLFESASQVALIVITSEDMERDKKELEDLVAEAEMDLNHVEFMQPGNVERMNKLQDVLDGYYKNCVQKLRDWQDAYATALDKAMEAALKAALTQKITKLKQDLLDYKRSVLVKQESMSAAVVSQPGSGVDQADQLAKHLKQEAKDKFR
jgi:hypothetical protein